MTAALLVPAAPVALAALLAQQGARPPLWVPFSIIGTLIAVFLVISWLSRRAMHRRHARVAEALEAAGFRIEIGSGTPDEVLALLPEGRRSGQRVLWHAASGDTRGLHVFEHSSVVGSGKNRRTVTATIAATPAPPTWPNLSLGAENLFTRIGAALGWKDLQLDDDAFNRRWRIRGTSEDFAIVALTPDVQAWLMNAPAGERWHIGGGWIVCVRDGAIDGPGAADFAARPATLRAGLPRELDAWNAGQGSSASPAAT